MLHMNKPNDIWDRIFQLMLQGAKSAEAGNDTNAYFCFGMASGTLIEGTNCTSADQLQRMSHLRESLLGLHRRK